MNSFLLQRAKIIAHAGVSYSEGFAYPKNTKEGVVASLLDDANDGVEFDICLTADGVVVVGHEKQTTICERTGMQVVVDDIGRCSYKELQRLKFIANTSLIPGISKGDLSFFDPNVDEVVGFYRRVAEHSYRITTLKELMKQLAINRNLRKKKIQVEVKCARMDEKRAAEFAEKIAEICAPYVSWNLVFISRDLFVLKELSGMVKEVNCAVVIGYNDAYKVLDAKELNFGVSAAINHCYYVVEGKTKLIDFVLQNDIELSLWNLSNEEQLKQALEVTQGTRFYAVGDMLNLTISKF